MSSLLADIRYSLRALGRAPGYAAVALLTLALGIGATAAIFTIVNGVLLRPLPYPEPEALVRIYQASPERGLTRSEFSTIDFSDWREQSRSFAGVAAYWSGSSRLSGDGEPIEVRSAHVTDDFFSVIGAPMRLGRALDPTDHREAARVAVISESLWRTRYGARADVVGDVIVLDGEPMTVVGVAPVELRYPLSATGVWIPSSLITEESHGPQVRSNRYLEGVARLASGTTPQQAQSDLTAIANRLAAENPSSNTDWSAATVVPLHEVVIGNVDRTLLVVLGLSTFVLLIGCANLANLVMARAAGRSREIAVRAALGAGRWRIVRQLSTEALVLSVIGGALGLVLATWAVEVMLRLSADTLPRADEVGVDLRVVGFALIVAVLTSLIFGLLPALRVAGAAPQRGLRGARGSVGTPGSRLRSALVVAEVMLAVLLVIGAGLMARSFLALRAVDPGFAVDRVLTVDLSIATPPQLGSAEANAFLISRKEELEARLAGLPGVEAVGTINRLPIAGEGEPFEFTVTGADGSERAVRTDARFVSPGYFAAMGIPLHRGTLFELQPQEEVPPIVVSESMAARLWPGEDPIGKRAQGPWGGEAMVVGVVGDVRQLELSREPLPAIYMSQFQAPRSATAYVIRTASDARHLVRAVRGEILAVDGNQPIRSIAPLSRVLSESIARDRFFTIVFAAFGGIALVLAALGIYGVLAYSVGQRTREIGVRMALGARAEDVLRMVIRSGMALVGGGVVLGTIAALLLTRVMASLLHDVSHRDPATFALVPMLLCAVALLAAYVPALRATRVQPMTALRNE
jgi:predicted permease